MKKIVKREYTQKNFWLLPSLITLAGIIMAFLLIFLDIRIDQKAIPFFYPSKFFLLAPKALAQPCRL